MRETDRADMMMKQLLVNHEHGILALGRDVLRR